MIKILTPEDKQILRVVSNYLRSEGLREGTIEIDMEYGDISEDQIENYRYFSNSYNVEIPDELTLLLKKVLSKVLEEGLLKTPDVDDLNYERISLEIDTLSKSLTIEHFWSYYSRGETDANSWTVDDYEDEEENPIVKMFQDILQENPNTPKNKTLTLRYNGSGDSGYIEDYFEEGGDVPSSVQDWCYRQLENHHGGWEINEGSDGQFIFNLNEETVELLHTFNNEESETDTIYEEKF